MSSSRIDDLLDEVAAAFDRKPEEIEEGLDVESTEILQLRKACRLLESAEELLDDGYYTFGVEAAFVAIERTVQFRLLDKGTTGPRDLPGSHPGTYEEAALAGIFTEEQAEKLAANWMKYRARTYYRDGLASRLRAEKMYELASEVHAFIVGRSDQGHECRCG